MMSSLEFEQNGAQVSWAEIVEEEEEVERKLLSNGLAEGSGSEAMDGGNSEPSSPVSLDDVEMRETTPAPRRLNLKHGFMRFIVRNQLDRKNFEEEQTEQKSVRYSHAKEQQEAEQQEKAAVNNRRDRGKKNQKKGRKNELNNRSPKAQEQKNENKQANKVAKWKKGQSPEKKAEPEQVDVSRKRPERAQRAGFAPYTPPHLRANIAPS
ncbi:hypothetical protein BSKO_00133 [Bryopsis sp. KO-2023]|nr:hypothetical protein BSKO_00133 [Bryopsis sp. KO-2023]